MQVRTYTSDVTAAGASRPAALSARAAEFLRLRHAADLWLIFGTFSFAALVFIWPSAFSVGLGIWWLLNTVSHNFIHHPFFRSRWANRLFALYLSVLTLVPQRLWRDRHLAHHADAAWRFRFSREVLLQFLLVALVWSAGFLTNPHFTLSSLAPGFVLAMALCWLHGYFEHAQGTTSHYSRIYNRLFFNDGFHVEHHEHPALHWTALPRARLNSAVSRWPAVLRWCDWFNLNALESVVAKSPLLQRWIVASHQKAVRKLTSGWPIPKRVVVIGGALFPRTALVVHALWPSAQITVIDSNSFHLERCRAWLRGDETLICARVTTDALPAADLIFVPLAFDQDKRPLYTAENHGCIILHDWLWNRPRRGQTIQSVIVSLLLLKRLNLVTR
jgi:hypothetical protein